MSYLRDELLLANIDPDLIDAIVPASLLAHQAGVDFDHSLLRLARDFQAPVDWQRWYAFLRSLPRKPRAYRSSRQRRSHRRAE